VDHGDVNYIDRRLPDVFIRIAHKPYAKKVGGQTGQAVPGVFVDQTFASGCP